MELKVLFSLALGPFLVLCWLSTAWQDLRRREIALLPLLGLSLAGLWGQAPLWWVAVAVTFFWRWEPQGSLALIPLLFGVGLVTEAYAPTMALVGGLTAWALGWWGGADGILLTVLALRYGLPGLMAGTLVTTVFGVLFLIARRRLLALVPAWADLLAARPVYLTGPGSSRNELPAATALSAAGVVLELLHFFSIFYGGDRMTLVLIMLISAQLSVGLTLLKIGPESSHTALGGSLLTLGGALLSASLAVSHGQLLAPFVSGVWLSWYLPTLLGIGLVLAGLWTTVVYLRRHRAAQKMLKQRVSQVTS